MKKIISAMAIVLSLLTGMTMCDTKKIGFVDTQRLMFETKAGQDAAKRINEVREKYSSEINTDLVKIKKAGEELEKTKGLKTREAVEKEAAKIRDQEVDLQAKAKKYEENWKEEAQRESQKVFEEARLSIKEIAEKNKLSAMIEVNAAPYICDEDNYTDQVKSTMDSKYEQKTKTA